MYQKLHDILYEFIRGIFVQFKDELGKLNGTARHLCTNELFNCLNIEITNLYMETKSYGFEIPPLDLSQCNFLSLFASHKYIIVFIEELNMLKLFEWHVNKLEKTMKDQEDRTGNIITIMRKKYSILTNCAC